jgi:hypothetical protein
MKKIVVVLSLVALLGTAGVRAHVAYRPGGRRGGFCGCWVATAVIGETIDYSELPNI